jgi:hypothetical protein
MTKTKSAEVGTWFEPIAEELAGDRTKLIEHLRQGKEILLPPDVAEFIAHLLEPGSRLPDKFLEIRQWKPHRRKLMRAVEELVNDQAAWYGQKPDRKRRSWPRAKRLEKFAEQHGVSVSQLENAFNDHVRLKKYLNRE